MPRKKEISFEDALSKLEDIVANMESNDCSLDELMKNYTEGIRLGNYCEKMLAAAEENMDLVLAKQGKKIVTNKLTVEGA